MTAISGKNIPINDYYKKNVLTDGRYKKITEIPKKDQSIFIKIKHISDSIKWIISHPFITPLYVFSKIETKIDKKFNTNIGLINRVVKREINNELEKEKIDVAQQIEFWLSAPWRRNDCNEIIYDKPESHGKIILGALPVHNEGMFNNLTNEENGVLPPESAVISVNEPWERVEQPNSKPVTKEEWEKKLIRYLPIKGKDHKFVPPEELYKAAQGMQSTIKDGHNVYVHCRAGVGRSATAVAAYLILEGLSYKEAAAVIKASRKNSTIFKKEQALKDFENYLDEHNLRPKNPSLKDLQEKLKNDPSTQKIIKANYKEPKLIKV